MDTRIVALLVFITVAGSFAELHVPFHRARRSPSNYAWTGTSNGPGTAASFASASAGSYGGGASYGAKQPSLATRGGFEEGSPNAANVPNMASSGGFGYSGGDTPSYFDPNAFVFPGYNLENFQRQMEEHFRQLQNQFQKQQQTLFDTANRIGTEGYSGGANPGANIAASNIRLGPNGGYQSGVISPVAPGLQSRFGEDIPPPSGGTYGVFSSSSSKTVVGPDGKQHSEKSSTTGVNDNGKITFRTVHD
ncbi:PREDICTED: uncharacterized protein LOC107193505 [Dufourea novaeangliae]|uniref:uncharacterized protein LOC107193505 n=1 Tax=Dufourea novaeangliae TaxID=178035 RepID=UPI000767363E|nr:PREDICTED: uncharacterized protein LOC107193505 [Dufourea novaeangliae]